MPINNKLLAYIGFSIKSRNILFGYETILTGRKKIYLVLVDEAISESSKKKIASFTVNKNIPIFYLETGVLSQLCGGRNIKCIALTDAGLASGAEKVLKTSEVITDERNK